MKNSGRTVKANKRHIGKCLNAKDEYLVLALHF